MLLREIHEGIELSGRHRHRRYAAHPRHQPHVRKRLRYDLRRMPGSHPGQLLLGHAGPHRELAGADHRHDRVAGVELTARPQSPGGGICIGPLSLPPLAVVDDAIGRRTNRHPFALGLEFGQIFRGLAVIVPRLLELQPLLLQGHGQPRLGPLKIKLRRAVEILEILTPPRQIEAGHPFVAVPDEGRVEPGHLGLEPGPLEHDLLRLLGQVILLIHLLELRELLLGVRQ